MPAFPAYKTKPYYGELSAFLAVSIDLATGELKDSAVDAKLQAALANADNVTAAAADAVATEAATFDYGPYVQDDVEAALAADPTPANAAAAAAETAVTNEIIGRDLLEGADILEDDIAFAVVDEDGRRTWLEAGMDGGLTDHSVSKISEHISGAQDADMSADGLAFAVVDENNARTWIEADADGKPTARALTLIGEGLGAISASTQTAFPTDDWAHWGDSLTAAGSGDWPALLSAMTGRNHYNGGWGGQSTRQIAARQGGVPARVTLTGNTIPASGAVTVTSIVNTPLSEGGSRLGYLAGVEGTLALSGGTHTFTRSAAGEAVPVAAAEPFTPWHGDTYRNRTVTIWTGRNGVLTTDPATLAADIRAMIDYLSPSVKRVIVLSITPKSTETTGTADRTTLNAANAYLAAAFAPYWVDITAWLQSTDAATAAGITFTAQDTTDIGNGLIPTSFRSDSTHFNTDGWEAIAARVYTEAQTRGWL